MIKRVVSIVLLFTLFLPVELATGIDFATIEKSKKLEISEKTVVKDIRVRKALSLAVDRKFITERVLPVKRTPATGFVPYGFRMSSGKDFREVVAANYPINKHELDIAMAKKLLAEAGFPNGEGFPTLNLNYNNGFEHKIIAEAIQKMWANNLGIKSELKEMEWKELKGNIAEGKFAIARAGWIGDFNDPMSFLSMYTSTSENNNAFWSNEAYDDLIQKSKLATGTERVNLLAKAEKLLMDEAVVMPLYYYSSHFQVQNSVKGWYHSNSWLFDYGVASTPNAILKWNIGYEPETMDPNYAYKNESMSVINQMFEGLMRRDANGLKPAVAKSYSISPDGKTYTFKIRDNAKWSDGKAITAADFEFSWKRALDPYIGSNYGFNLFCIEGARAYYEGTGSEEEVAVKAMDSKTLQVKLVEPTPEFVELVSTSIYMPVRKDMVSKNEDQWSLMPKYAVSNGPFKLKEYAEGKRVILEANKNWWRSHERKLKTIEILMIEDEESAVKLFKEKKLDVNEMLSSESVNQLMDKDSTLKTYPQIGNYYYVFSLE